MSHPLPFFCHAQFIMSADSYQELPLIGPCDIAFSGRSNVGKSSLINLLTQKKQLARTSKHPGKTQLLNLFSIQEKCALVDLPGYGYANLSHTQAQLISQRIHAYLRHRKALALLVLCLDVRRGIMESDRQWIEMIQSRAETHWLIVANKCDKLSQKERHHAQKQLFQSLDCFPKKPLELIFTSAMKKTGLEQLILSLENFLQSTVSSAEKE